MKDNPKEQEFKTKVKKVAEKIKKEAKKTWVYNDEGKGCSLFAEGFFAIFFNIIWILILNKYYTEVDFLTDDFEDVLIVMNLSIVVSIILHFGLMILRTSWYKSIMNIINNFFSIIVMGVLFVVYPFEFTGNWEIFQTLFRIGLLVFIFIVGIASIVESIKLALNFVKKFAKAC